MAIHHATLKAAAAQGVILTQDGLKITAHNPRTGLFLVGEGKARATLDAMTDLLWLKDYLDAEGIDHEIVPEGDHAAKDCSEMTLKVGSWDASGHPSDVRAAFQTRDMSQAETPEEAAEALGVEVEELEDDSEDEQEHRGGSVVSDTYRAKYAEAGHPNHCGDELAVWLDTNCANKKGTNLELFEAICAMNGVDLSKYNRTTPGWQGRLRMTGRNMLARRVYTNGGSMVVPETMGGSVNMGGEWMATRKFAQPKKGGAA